jgi:AraC-like DNA-binding protein
MISTRIIKSVFFFFNPQLANEFLQAGLSACFLIENAQKVDDIAYACGFNSTSTFYLLKILNVVGIIPNDHLLDFSSYYFTHWRVLSCKAHA